MKTQPQRPLEEDLKDTALEIVLNCISYSSISNRIAAGKIKDADLIAFNMGVANKIYTYLYYNFKCAPEEDVGSFLEMVKLNYSTNYKRPELDKDMVAAVENMKKLKGNNS